MFHKSIHYALEKLGKSKSGFERTVVSKFKRKRRVGSGNELIDYSRALCLGADQKARGLWERDWDLVIFYWFVLSMRMQVILDSSFARPGSAPIWGGKKGEFRDWTVALHFRPAWQTCLTPFDQLYVLLFLPIKMRCDRVFRNHFTMGWDGART